MNRRRFWNDKQRVIAYNIRCVKRIPYLKIWDVDFWSFTVFQIKKERELWITQN